MSSCIIQSKFFKIKKGSPLKQIFNINLGTGIIKKLLFLYFQHISLFSYSNFDQESSLDAELNFASNEDPLDILFMGPLYPKNKKYPKKCDDDVIIMFFQVFLVFGEVGPIKSMPSGYPLDVELNYASNEYPFGIPFRGFATQKIRNT